MNPSDAIQRSDQELLELYYRERSNKWLGILFDRYLHLVFGVCMKYFKDEQQAKDQAQQVCLHVLQTLPRHRVTYFKSWLYQVTKNHCLMQLRQAGRHIQSLVEDRELPAGAAEGDIRDKQEREVAYGHLEQALQALNEPQRRCVEMFYMGKKSYQQVAEATGYTLLQVKSHIQNGKRNLRQLMERLAGEEGEERKA